MIPTAYLRMFYVNVGDERGKLQQLWVWALMSETHFYPREYLEQHGGEWRDVPSVYASTVREQVGGATNQLHNDSASAQNSPQDQK